MILAIPGTDRDIIVSTVRKDMSFRSPHRY